MSSGMRVGLCRHYGFGGWHRRLPVVLVVDVADRFGEDAALLGALACRIGNLYRVTGGRVFLGHEGA